MSKCACQELKPGSVVQVDNDMNCIKCGRNMRAKGALITLENAASILDARAQELEVGIKDKFHAKPQRFPHKASLFREIAKALRGEIIT